MTGHFISNTTLNFKHSPTIGGTSPTINFYDSSRYADDLMYPSAYNFSRMKL
ncbi:hypothetical protein XACM_0125 [Xanthomonas euvesicatoria pv. citrumelo F1]|nr:hypothetical protein XACM_0125 [Xanthomonas euvesicatoria pv. citrumelo F1]